MGLEEVEEGSLGFGKYRGDTDADFFERIKADLHDREWLKGGEVSVSALARWCVATIDGFGGEEFEEAGAVAEYMRLEFRIMYEQRAKPMSAGGMEDGAREVDVDVERREIAEAVAGVAKMNFGWHGISDEPSGVQDVGRFEKAYPLEFPMGIGGLYDDMRHELRRPTARQWAQHLLRLWGGWCVHGLRGHRLVWAIVNTVLLQETRGKSYIVQKAALRRLGYPAGEAPMTREELKAVLHHEETAGSVVNCLMKVGSSVRSTPMQWASESRDLDTCVKHLSWPQPWVVPAQGCNMNEPPYCYLHENATTKDHLGCGVKGRIPGAWWTLNHRYNFDYEVHRLSTGEGMGEAEVREMLGSVDQVLATCSLQVRT